MSNFGLDFGPDDEGAVPPHEEPAAPLPRAGSRRGEPTRRRTGCIPLLLVLALIVVGLFFGGGAVLDKVKSLTGGSADYSGSGSGSVVIEVSKGDSSAAIGRTLKAAGVVKSVGAFTKAASADARSQRIGPGQYTMKKQMKASAALALLISGDSRVQVSVTIPEGTRLSEFPAIIAKDVAKGGRKDTVITKAQVKAALANPGKLGLPSYANGNPEGFLFPSTYEITPGETATELLREMVATGISIDKKLGITAKAKALNMTPGQILTVASILEFEASNDTDYRKVARAIYNRLDIGMALQSDATVAFANNLTKTLYTTDAQRAIDSPYNTYKFTGLPPGPIGAPGETTINAALNPAKGSWLYWVVVDLSTGETRFANTYAEHQQNVALFRQYCQTSDAC